MPLAPNDIAPDFILPDQNGTLVSLNELLAEGPAVVFFYPKDDTPGCTRQACSFRDNYARITAKGVRVAGISRDDARSHTAFRQKHELPFTLLSDTDGAVHRVWGCTLFGLLTRRVTFLIGPDHRIRLAHESKLRMDSHVEAVLRAL
ncbi:peroxiredoxin [Cyclonatronum proteinivorum]|nr:peroxiredoxin [Cyclonatronum proteinivorum]